MRLMATPPRVGPRSAAPFHNKEFSATAFGRTARGTSEGNDGGTDEGECVDLPGLNVTGMVQYAEAQSQQTQKKLGPEHEASSIVAISEGAADESEADGGDRAEDAVEPQLNRRIRQFIEQPIGCRHLHPGADVGNKKADPKKSKIAIVKGSKTPDFSRVGGG